jgi:hypothetical protein
MGIVRVVSEPLGTTELYRAHAVPDDHDRLQSVGLQQHCIAQELGRPMVKEGLYKVMDDRLHIIRQRICANFAQIEVLGRGRKHEVWKPSVLH